MLQRDNVSVSVFLVTSKGAELLGSTVQGVDPGCLAPPRGDICDVIISKIVKEREDDSAMLRESPAWAAAFLQSLCHARRVAHKTPDEDGLHLDLGGPPVTESCRILSIVSNFENSSKKYLSFMNGFFAAQRDAILIDCCNLETEGGISSCESLFQQGCQLTGGFYLKPKNPESLLEYLMTAFMADSSVRTLLRYPSACGVDFRASCFCHQKLVEMGYVCSVCLSIFCDKINVCLTCGSEFTNHG